MALGRSFEEVMQKGLRMLQIGLIGLTENERLGLDTENLKKIIAEPTPKRVIAIAEALGQGWSIERIQELSGIDPWFLGKLKNIVDMSARLEKEKLDEKLMRSAKKYGFSDKQIGIAAKQDEMEIVEVIWYESTSLTQMSALTQKPCRASTTLSGKTS